MIGNGKEPDGETQVCPACGGENTGDAVFCSNASCHKALGEFRYVTEEIHAKASWHERLAERFTRWMTGPHFVVAHVVWFAVWVLLNTGIFWFVKVFDEYPYPVLVTILAVETLMITIFVLISSNRQMAHASQRDELDYEVSVQTYRKVLALDKDIQELRQRLAQSDSNGFVLAAGNLSREEVR